MYGLLSTKTIFFVSIQVLCYKKFQIMNKELLFNF